MCDACFKTSICLCISFVEAQIIATSHEPPTASNAITTAHVSALHCWKCSLGLLPNASALPRAPQPERGIGIVHTVYGIFFRIMCLEQLPECHSFGSGLKIKLQAQKRTQEVTVVYI